MNKGFEFICMSSGEADNSVILSWWLPGVKVLEFTTTFKFPSKDDAIKFMQSGFKIKNAVLYGGEPYKKDTKTFNSTMQVEK